MSFISIIREKLKLKCPATSEPAEDILANEQPDLDAQLICFENGKLYKVYPTDEESWYDARYLITDGKLYDLEKIEDIRQIPIPDFSKHDNMMEGYGVTGSLDYVLRMKAGNARKKGLIAESDELYKKAIVLMQKSGIFYDIKPYLYFAKELLREGRFEESQKEEERIYELFKRKPDNSYISLDEKEYYRIKYTIPEAAPKSLNAYVRMKNAKTDNFYKIVEKAKKNGIIISIPAEKPKRMSTYDLERFAVECNAILEHEDEMSQYKKINDETEYDNTKIPQNEHFLKPAPPIDQPQTYEKKTREKSLDITSNNVCNFDGLDTLFREVGNLVISTKRASIGMFQRKFHIGFNRAERIMNQLAEAGVVGEEDGTKPRAILMNQEQFDNFIGYIDVMTVTEREAFLQHLGVSCNLTEPIKNKPLPNHLMDRIKAYRCKFDYMTSREFEFFCADLLKQDGFEIVSVTSESRDQGVDIIADKDGKKYGILCKHSTSDTNIGTRAVSEVFSGAAFYDCQISVVLTNSYFTSTAEELAEKINVLLWDREYLTKLCITYCKEVLSDEVSTDETDSILDKSKTQETNNSIEIP